MHQAFSGITMMIVFMAFGLLIVSTVDFEKELTAKIRAMNDMMSLLIFLFKYDYL